MRNIKIISLIALFLTGLFLVPQLSEAAKSVVPYPPGYHQGGQSGHSYSSHGGYYGHGYYGNGYYGRGFFGFPYWGGFYPYYGLGYGAGYGYGYGYGGYGYRPYGHGPYGYGPYGEIRTEVKPQNAQIFVDGGYVGKADDFDGWWQRLDLEPGRHRIVFRAPGFQPYVTDVRVLPGTDIHMKYEMRPGNDNIAENDMMLPRQEYSRRQYDHNRNYGPRPNPYQQPYHNRDYNDRDDNDHNDRDDQYERRPPQEDRDRDYGDNDNDNDQPYYGEQQRGDRDMDQRPLIVHVEPPDATVYIDGNYYGTANDNGRGELQALLPAGVHRVEVVRPGFDSYSQQVTVGRDRDNRIDIVLKRK